MPLKAADARAEAADTVKTAHRGTITGLHVFRDFRQQQGTGRFMTSGADGRLVTWDLSGLTDSIAALHI